MKRRSRAHSLLELTVAMALTSVLLLCTHQLLAAASRYYTNAQITLELQQALLAACSRVQVELAESNYSCIVVDEGPPACVIFITPRRFDGKVTVVNGKAQWFRIVCFYSDIHNGVPCLLWKESAFLPPVSVPPYPAVPAPRDKVAWWVASDRIPAHVVARNITSFKVTDTTPLLIQMEASDTTGRYQFLVEARVHPKN